MEPDYKEIVARLEADKKYYDGVLTSFLKDPPETVAGSTTAQQKAAIANIVKRLDDALAIAKGHLNLA